MFAGPKSLHSLLHNYTILDKSGSTRAKLRQKPKSSLKPKDCHPLLDAQFHLYTGSSHFQLSANHSLQKQMYLAFPLL